MSGKNENMVNKNVAIALGIIAMILFTGIIVVFAYYSTAVTQRDNIIATKEQEILSLQNEVTGLEEQVTELQDQVEAQQNQILSLQNQLANTAARVINVGLGARDDRSNPNDPFLYVSGYVCNIGAETAHNVRLHVTAYQGSVQVINSYYEIADALGREGSKYVEARFYYSGPALTYNSWTMTPEWT
jgi:Na+-transporting NADH:ubiquinone oxidoreductase subunit NqrC